MFAPSTMLQRSPCTIVAGGMVRSAVCQWVVLATLSAVTTPPAVSVIDEGSDLRTISTEKAAIEAPSGPLIRMILPASKTGGVGLCAVAISIPVTPLGLDTATIEKASPVVVTVIRPLESTLVAKPPTRSISAASFPAMPTIPPLVSLSVAV